MWASPSMGTNGWSSLTPSDQEVAALMREAEIDIAIDLNGFTQGGRLPILARRPAPIQVNYLGYSSTMGADFIDYVIADQTVIPSDQQKFYTENVVYLPDSYFATDDTRQISDVIPSRTELGLPERGFVAAGKRQPSSRAHAREKIL